MEIVMQRLQLLSKDERFIILTLFLLILTLHPFFLLSNLFKFDPSVVDGLWVNKVPFDGKG